VTPNHALHRTAGRKSPVSLYNPAITTGFIRLNALRLKVAARVRRKK
jgi:hypothetical protein